MSLSLDLSTDSLLTDFYMDKYIESTIQVPCLLIDCDAKFKLNPESAESIYSTDFGDSKQTFEILADYP